MELIPRPLQMTRWHSHRIKPSILMFGPCIQTFVCFNRWFSYICFGFRGLMKESNQRRSDSDHDEFWKFLSFLLYFFLNVSKFLAADPIKKGKNTWWKMFWKQTAIRIRKKIANTSHYVFHITCLTEETFKCVSKYIKAFLRSFTNFLEFSYSGFYFQVLQMNWKFGMEFISNELGLFLLLLFLYSYNLHQRRFSR